MNLLDGNFRPEAIDITNAAASRDQAVTCDRSFTGFIKTRCSAAWSPRRQRRNRGCSPPVWITSWGRYLRRQKVFSGRAVDINGHDIPGSQVPYRVSVLHDDTTLGTPTVFFQCLAESLTVAPVACHRDPARPAEVFTATSRRVLAVATPPSPSAIALAPPAAP